MTVSNLILLILVAVMLAVCNSVQAGEYSWTQPTTIDQLTILEGCGPASKANSDAKNAFVQLKLSASASKYGFKMSAPFAQARLDMLLHAKTHGKKVLLYYYQNNLLPDDPEQLSGKVLRGSKGGCQAIADTTMIIRGITVQD